MKSQDRLNVISNAHAAFADDEQDYVNFPTSSKSEQIGKAAKFDIYGFLFKSTVALIVLALLFVVAIYYRVINP